MSCRTLNTNGTGSGFTITGGRNFTTAGDFTNNGTLTVGSGSTFDVNGNLTNFSAKKLTGGTYNVTRNTPVQQREYRDQCRKHHADGRGLQDC